MIRFRVVACVGVKRVDFEAWDELRLQPFQFSDVGRGATFGIGSKDQMRCAVDDDLAFGEACVGAGGGFSACSIASTDEVRADA